MIYRIIHSLMRSGSTVFSRCISAMPDVALLSEVHEHAHYTSTASFNITCQAHNWHDAFDIENGDLPERNDLSFYGDVDFTCACLVKKGKVPILRSWTHVDFVPFKGMPSPSNRLSMFDGLKDKGDCLQVALIRDPMDIWMSLVAFDQVNFQLGYGDFLDCWNMYCEAVKRAGCLLVNYSEFTQNPNDILKDVCDFFDMKYSPGYKKDWKLEKQITGDVSGSRGGFEEIKILPSRLGEL